MPHELDRDDAWYIVEQIGAFDLGSMDAWSWWFKNIWRRLEASKWFEELCVRDSPVYATQQRITLFALRWIAEDFVAVLDGLTDPEWREWIGLLDLDADKLLGVVRGHPQWTGIEDEIREELGEAEVYDDPDDTEQAQKDHDEELNSRLLPQAACFAAAHQRQRLASWLRRLFVRSDQLFQSLWSVTHCGDTRLVGATCQDQAQYGDLCDKSAPFDPESDPDLSTELAAQLNTVATASLTDSLGIDAETAERMSAWEWVAGGCRVRSQGYPQYIGPWQD
jgi:hypothetical protein